MQGVVFEDAVEDLAPEGARQAHTAAAVEAEAPDHGRYGALRGIEIRPRHWWRRAVDAFHKVEPRSGAPLRGVGRDAQIGGEAAQEDYRKIGHSGRTAEAVETPNGVEDEGSERLVCRRDTQQALECLGQEEGYDRFGRVGGGFGRDGERPHVAYGVDVAPGAYVDLACKEAQRHHQGSSSSRLAARSVGHREREAAELAAPGGDDRPSVVVPDGAQGKAF